MHTPLAVTAHELQQLLSDVAFTKNYGFRLSTIAEGACTLHVPFQAAFERPGGLISGQVFMAAADVAMWLAIMTKLGTTDQSVTVELTTAFLYRFPVVMEKFLALRGEPSMILLQTG